MFVSHTEQKQCGFPPQSHVWGSCLRTICDPQWMTLENYQQESFGLGVPPGQYFFEVK